MLILILIGIIFVLIYTKSFRRNSDDRKINKLMMRLQSICQAENIEVEFNLFESDTLTYADGSDIYIVIRKNNGEYYDNNTLLHAAIHEISHLLCPSRGHNKLFDKIQKCLQRRAKKLYDFDEDFMDSEYPCQDADE